MSKKEVQESQFILMQDGKPFGAKPRVKAFLAFMVTLFILLAASLIKYIFIDDFAERLNKYSILSYASFSILFALLISAFMLYVFFSRRDWMIRIKILLLVLFSVLVGYISGLFLQLVDIYFVPIFLTAYLLAPLLNRKDTFIANFIVNMLLFAALMVESIVMGKDMLSIFVMFIVGIIGGTIISYTISDDPKKLNFLIKGTLINISSMAVLIILFFVRTDKEHIMDFRQYIIYLAISSMASMVIGLLMQFILERIFNITTNSRLIELTDHSAPLIKRLIEEAPGTFNHSVSVAGFAQICATAIGENPYLARACAYYHDIGKLVNAQYFKENQADFNPHDNMLPEVSAEIIRNHTTDGLELCKSYHIPEEIACVTVQHHGTMPIAVFYNKATKLTDSAVDIYDYSYHGIPPVTKMAAIIMVCDSSEAAIRAMDAPNGERVEKLLTSLIGARISAGQFDNCDITMRELNVIKQTIIAAYGGVFHTRLKYPEGN